MIACVGLVGIGMIVAGVVLSVGTPSMPIVLVMCGLSILWVIQENYRWVRKKEKSS